MKIKIIDIKDIKNLKNYNCLSCLIPTTTGIIFINDQSRKITTETQPGIIKIETDGGFVETHIEKNGLCYFDQKKLFIFLK